MLVKWAAYIVYDFRWGGFFSKLIYNITIPHSLDFVVVSSWRLCLNIMQIIRSSLLSNSQIMILNRMTKMDIVYEEYNGDDYWIV